MLIDAYAFCHTLPLPDTTARRQLLPALLLIVVTPLPPRHHASRLLHAAVTIRCRWLDFR